MGLNLSLTTVDEMDQGEVVDVQGEIIFHFHTYIIAMYDFKIQNSTLIHITTLCALIVSLLYIKSI